MIRITQIITYLRENLPTWSVEGAYDQAVAENDSVLPLPAMYVGLKDIKYTDQSDSTYLQDYIETFFVITCTPTTSSHDRTGKYAQDFVATVREYLFKLLVNNKQFDPDSHVITMSQDFPEKFDKARYYHRFELKIRGRISPDDVTPLQLDKFDTFYAEYKTPDFTEETPKVESLDQHLYFTPPED